MMRVRRAMAMAVSRLPGRLRVWGYRWLLGATIGPGSRIGFGTVIVADTIRLGARTTIGPRCEIEASRQRSDSCATTGVTRSTPRCQPPVTCALSGGATPPSLPFGERRYPRADVSWRLPTAPHWPRSMPRDSWPTTMPGGVELSAMS